MAKDTNNICLIIQYEGLKTMDKIKKTLLLVCMALCSTSMFAQVSNNNEDGVYKVSKGAPRYKDGEIIVKFKDSENIAVKRNAKGRYIAAPTNKVQKQLSAIGGLGMEQLMPLTGAKVSKGSRKAISTNQQITDTDLSQLYVVRFDKNKMQVEAALEQVKSWDNVEYAEPNGLVYVCSTDDGSPTFDDPLYSQQWGLSAINLPQLWSMSKVDNRRPIIAILDTGVDITHPDLAANIWTNQTEADGQEFADDDANGYYDDLHGWDFVNNTPIIDKGMDKNGHGTHCAGIAAACGNNGIGIVGANPDAFILPVKVMGDNGQGDVATIIRGIDYAIACNADVLSMSIGGFPSSALEEALRKGYAKDIISVGAAGNGGADINFLDRLIPSPSAPGCYDFVIGVMASDSYSDRAVFSNYDSDGPFYSRYTEEYDNAYWNYEVMAPGCGIISTFPNGKYKELSGTSMATPLVAGAISRLLQVKGFDYARDKGLIADIAMSVNDYNVFNVAAAANITEANRQIVLCLASVKVDDSLGDGDGNIDAGEVIDFYPTVRSLGGYAHNIKISVALADNIQDDAIEILNNNVDLGYELNSQGSAISVNPIKIKINESLNDGYNLRLLFTVNCDEQIDGKTNAEKEISYIIDNGIELGGMISQDMTLHPNVHYIVSRSLAIPQGVTLTIEPGTILKFKQGTGISSAGSISAVGTSENPIIFTSSENGLVSFEGIKFDNSDHTFKYMIVENLSCDYMFSISSYSTGIKPTISDCVIRNCDYSYLLHSYHGFSIDKCNVYDNGKQRYGTFCQNLSGETHPNSTNCSIVNNKSSYGLSVPSENSNIMNNRYGSNICNLYYYDSSPNVIRTTDYFGSQRDDIIHEGIFDINNPSKQVGFGMVDITDALRRPSTEAHGIVWKVVVNGKDAQDEFEELPPLGAGVHKFEVYFNRPMNKAVAPKISMGLCEPYTQTVIEEDGTWNEAGNIYSAYLTISGKSNYDGLNRIRVCGAQDDEYFDIPEESSRFNVMVQKTGSMSTGLMAEAGLGKVKLTWETDADSFADLMGYNVYRFEDPKDDSNEEMLDMWDDEGNWYQEKGHWDEYGNWVKFVAQDTIMVNTSLIEPYETEFVDYDVVPGTTYYYLVKEMGTDLLQHDISNVVAATPLTAQKGDANGSMSVDVADVVTEVAYLTDQDPQPFIFEAADVNEDNTINILDVVGTVNLIMTPAGAGTASADNTATFTVEDGILYVDATTPLGGVQVLVNADADADTEFETLEGLNGMERTGNWMSANEYQLLAFSMVGNTISIGKQPLLRIGDATVKTLVASDAKGKNVLAINGATTSIEQLPFGIDDMKNAEMRYYDLSGRMISSQAAKKKGMYIQSIFVGGKCVKSYKIMK